MSEEKKAIPVVKAARVGNYKLWRTRRDDMESINISNLDGSWKVVIPQTSTMFSMIAMTFGDDDEKKSEDMLKMLFGNMMNVCLVSNPYLHDSFSFLMEMLQFPYLLLSEKDMEKRMKVGFKDTGIDKKEVKDYIAKMTDYRRKLYEHIELRKSMFIEEYERQQAERRAKEAEANKQLEQDAIAEEAMKVIQENSDEGEGEGETEGN